MTYDGDGYSCCKWGVDIDVYMCRSLKSSSMFNAIVFFLFSLLQVIFGTSRIYISILHTQQRETLFEVGFKPSFVYAVERLIDLQSIKNMWTLSYDWALLIFLCSTRLELCVLFMFFFCFNVFVAGFRLFHQSSDVDEERQARLTSAPQSYRAA